MAHLLHADKIAIVAITMLADGHLRGGAPGYPNESLIAPRPAEQNTPTEWRLPSVDRTAGTEADQMVGGLRRANATNSQEIAAADASDDRSYGPEE